MAQKYFFFDTETSGLDAQLNDILQLGAIIEIDGVVKDEFVLTSQPFNYNNISADALKTNKFTVEQIRTFDTPQTMLTKLLSHLKKYVNPLDYKDRYIIVGQNAKFDAAMLKCFFAKNKYPQGFTDFFGHHFIDLLGINLLLQLKGLLPASNLKLETMVATYGIKTAKAHDAGEDIKATRNILKIIEDVFIKDINEIDFSKLDSATPLFNHLTSLKEMYGKEGKESPKVPI